MTSRANYDGLTRLRSAGTWSPNPSTFPIVLDKEIRGGLRYCSGADGDTLTNIPGAMLQEGMLVWLDATTGSFAGQNYYQYQLVGTEARDTATGTMPNNNANWTQVTLGGGGGGGGTTAQSVADVAALNTLAGTLDEDDNGLVVNLENSTDFNDPDETDPDVTNIPNPVPFTPGAEISVILAWVQTGPDAARSWRYIRYVRDDPDAAYVLETGDTMTGTLTIDNTTDDENALVTGAGHDIVLGRGANAVLTGTGTADPVNEQTITVSAPTGVAAFDANYEIVLPATEPTDANRFLRASGTGTTSPFTLEWAAAGGGGGASVSVGENPPEAAADDNEGDLWYNSDTGRLFISFTDAGDDSQWIDVAPAAVAVTPNLQQVTDAGNTTDNGAEFANGQFTIAENGGLTVQRTGSDGFVNLNSQGQFVLNGAATGTIFRIQPEGTNDNSLTIDGSGNVNINNGNIQLNADGQFVSMQSGNNSNLTLGLDDSGFFIRCRSGSTTGFNGTEQFRVAINGDCSNTNNVYGPFSDVKLKENIVDAKSQWEDLKAVRVVNFNFKEETGLDTHKQIGVIAQEVEGVSPGLVTDTPDVEEVLVTTTNPDGSKTTTSTMRETGTTTKTVATSVLYMKAVKALQEAIERIETLEAEVQALKEAK